MSSDHDHLLDPADLVGLEGQPIEEVRRLRASSVEVETGLSYLRRMVQGSIDIIEGELAHRAGHGPETTGDVVQALPGLLSESTRPPGNGRLTTTMDPTGLDDELVREYDELVGDGGLAKVAEADDGELHTFVKALYGIEQRVSVKRHAYHKRIDALQAELTRRYRTGEATVDSLLDAPADR